MPAQTLSVSTLAEKGYGENPHVIVTDYVCGDKMTYDYKVRKSENSGADTLIRGNGWIPLFPRQQKNQTPEPSRIRVLLETQSAIGNEAMFRTLAHPPILETIAKPITWFNMDEEKRRYFQAAYPDTDFQQCILLQEMNQTRKGDSPYISAFLGICSRIGFALGPPLIAIGFYYSYQKRRPKQETQPMLWPKDAPY